jgi:hypothetical protein
MRTHPEPELACLWLRRILEDLPSRERAEAVRRVYVGLMELWGDRDRRGMHSIDEALACMHVYGLWMDANGCTYSGCQHAKQEAEPGGNHRENLTWHARLLGSLLPPPYWFGTAREWRPLAGALRHNCTCRSLSAHVRTFPAHRLAEDQEVLNRFAFARHLAARFQSEEFAEPPHPP